MNDSSALIAVGVFYFIVIVFLTLIPMWLVFAKAGKPGWASLIPIYNAYLMIKISGKPGWWLLLMCIPFVNFVIMILTCTGLAKNFGKSSGFAAGLFLLGPIFFPILGYGKSQYVGE